MSEWIRRRFSLLAVLAVATFAVALVACGSDDTGPPAGGPTATAQPGDGTAAPTAELPADLTLTVGVPNDCGGPDFTSVAGTGGGNWVCTGLVTDPLLKTSLDTGEIRPYVAESYVISEDGMHRTYKLRPGIKFQNGEPLNAEALAFSYDRQLGRADYPGSAEFKPGDGPTLTARLDENEPYTIIDDLTIRLNYKILDVVHTGSITPVPPGYLKQVGDDGFAKAPITTGPYKLVSRTPASEIVLERNDDYWNKNDEVVPGDHRWSPQWKRIVHKVIPEEQTRISAVTVRQVDMITSISPFTIPRLERDESLTVVNIKGVQAIYIMINSCAETDPNTGQPNPFRNEKVRQAMTLAVDVDGIIKNILTGSESRHAGLPPNQAYADYGTLTYWPYDVARAKALMAEAGYPDGLPGEYDILVPTGRWTASSEVTEVVTAQLRAIGINARQRPVEYQVVTTGLQQHTLWPMAFFGVFSNLDSNIGGGMLGGHTAGSITCSGRWNVVMDDPEIKALSDQAIKTVDVEARAKLITQAYKIWSEKAYAIDLYANNVTHVVRADFEWQPPQFESTSTYAPKAIRPPAR